MKTKRRKIVKHKKTRRKRRLRGGNRSIHVLWVRHCESCANIANQKFMQLSFKDKIRNVKKWFKTKAFREPLCTHNGILQSFNFGQNLPAFFHHLQKSINLDGVDIYSSVLPRAMETAKIISVGANMDPSQGTIQRMAFIQEIKAPLEKGVQISDEFSNAGSTAVTTVAKSNCHAKMINKLFVHGLPLSENILEVGHHSKLQAKSDDYHNFLSKILPRLKPNRLNIIVSHGRYIKKYITKKHPHNLDGCLVTYKDGQQHITQRDVQKMFHNYHHLFLPHELITDYEQNKGFTTCQYSYSSGEPNPTVVGFANCQ